MEEFSKGENIKRNFSKIKMHFFTEKIERNPIERSLLCFSLSIVWFFISAGSKPSPFLKGKDEKTQKSF